MTNSKSTKRALLSSALVLLLCFSMLLGTTFAWFTDGATTGVNTILAGNLDIVVSYATQNDVVDGAIPDSAWTEIDEASPVFNPDALWEPGYTEVVYFKIENVGSLALKYKMSANIANELPGTNRDGKEFNLSDYLSAYHITADTATVFTKRENAQTVDGWATMIPALAPSTLADAVVAEIGSAKALSYEKSLKSGETAYTTMAVFMPTTVGNEANHNGTDVPVIRLGINVVATQYTSENDSFDDQYDKDAEYPVVKSYDYVVSSSDELMDAFEGGGNIKLESNIELDERLNLAEGVEVYLDLNGKTITANDSSVDPVFYTYKDSKLTIDGNGKVELANPSMSLIFPGGDVVIENGTFIRNVPEGTPVSQVGALFVGAKVSPWGSQSIVINGGYFDGGYYDANAADIEGILAGTITLVETENDIANRGKSGDKNLTRVALKNNIQYTLNLSYNLMRVYGGTFVGMNPAWGDEGCMLPTSPNYLRPWSYYQGALLDGQQFNENGIVLPEGYTITVGTTEDGRPTYTVTYSK